MKINIDTTLKTIEILENILIPDFLKELKILLGKDFLLYSIIIEPKYYNVCDKDGLL